MRVSRVCVRVSRVCVRVSRVCVRVYFSVIPVPSPPKFVLSSHISRLCLLNALKVLNSRPSLFSQPCQLHVLILDAFPPLCPVETVESGRLGEEWAWQT